MMEDNIFDFSKFKREKEEKKSEVIKAEGKKSEPDNLAGFMGMMADMIGQVSDAGGADKSVSDALSAFQLEFSPNGVIINKVRYSVNPQSTAYREAYERADQLSLEEIRGQIESANEMPIKAHPTWYVVLIDNLMNRSKPK